MVQKNNTHTHTTIQIILHLHNTTQTMTITIITYTIKHKKKLNQNKHIMKESMKNKNDIYSNLTVSLSKKEKKRTCDSGHTNH